MSIVTKCPGCGTTFRVTPQQLQAQQGMVRCGRCASVFVGFKTLATLSEAMPSEAAPAAAARDDMPGDMATSRRAGFELEPLSVTPAEPPVREMPAALALPEAAVSIALPESAPAAEGNDASAIERASMSHADAAASAQSVGLVPGPFAMSPGVKPAPRRPAGGWTFGILLLLAGLALQGAYFYRSEIAASVPEARPYLNKMCELLRCTVALPQRPRQISIEASDMQATDPANPGVIALTTTLRNHAAIELGYPALDVVLTNTKEHTVARRIFLPAEYLVPGNDPRTGIAPNAEVTVRLDLDTGDLGAAGFRLDVLAAPAL